jgi:hypothetical protein
VVDLLAVRAQASDEHSTGYEIGYYFGLIALPAGPAVSGARS